MATTSALMNYSKSALIKRVAAQNARIEKARSKSEEITQNVARLAITGTAAFVSAYASRRFGGPEGYKVGPVPAELGAAAVLYAGGLFNAAGGASHYLLEAGEGCLYGYLARLGTEVGVDQGQKALPSG